jgi:iron complex outermembrane receptor protein
VAVGAKAGVLGNQSVFNAPFNGTSFTDKLKRDQQSRAIIDLVACGP